MLTTLQKIILVVFALFFLGVLPTEVLAQDAQQDTTENNKVDVDHADIFEYLKKDVNVLQKLLGNVELAQDSILMYCDTAIIENDTRVYANGKVIIQQGDSLSIFSDSLVYDSELKKAKLFGDVILASQDQQLFTDRLDYDLNTKIATYFTGATLTDEETQLTSKTGYYYVDERQAYFKDSVVVIDPRFHLKSDTLQFDTETKWVYFLGPTLIANDSSRIYCESGHYDTQNEEAVFTQNAQYAKGTQAAIADTIQFDGKKETYYLLGDASFSDSLRNAVADQIIYDEAADKTILIGNARYQDEKQEVVADEIEYDAKKEVYSTKGRSTISDPPSLLEADQVDYDETKGMGVALGNVIWQDTSADLTIYCEQADYNRKTDYLKASGGQNGRPMLRTFLEGDSLFLASDTLLALKSDSLEQDSNRILVAYHDVRIFKSNLQGVCDSLRYNTSDSLFYFYQDPVIWSDTSQFSADTIHMQMAENQIDQIFLINKSFILNSPDEVFFNQIKGKNIIADFIEGELRTMDVQGNAESVYYVQDDLKAYVGVNKTICSDMLLHFGNNEVEKIVFFAEPKATMHPMKQANHDELIIEGFNWQIVRRPNSLADLFTAKVVVPTALEEELEEVNKLEVPASPPIKKYDQKK